MVINVKDHTDILKEDLLYNSLISFLYEIKIFQGGTALSSTLRRHPIIKAFLLRKQKERLNSFESSYFNSDGSLDYDSLDDLSEVIDKK